MNSNTEASSQQTDLKTPPQSIETEMAVLGSMILDPDCLADVFSILKTTDFYSHNHQIIYSAMRKLQDEKRGFDLVIMRDTLKQAGKLDQIGGVSYLMQLTDSVPSAVNATYYARIVKDKSLLRHMIKVCGQYQLEAYGHNGDVHDLLSELEADVYRLAEERTTKGPEPIQPTIQAVVDRLHQNESVSRLTRLASGFFELDDMLSGLHPGELVIIAARPSMGKTALGLNIAEYVARIEQKGVLLFSLEMGAEELAKRFLVSVSSVNTHGMRSGNISQERREELQAIADSFRPVTLMVDDSPRLGPMELLSKARSCQRRYGIDLILVDYLQLMHVPGCNNRYDEIGQISRALKLTARELNVPVVVLSQLSRGPESREDHRPRLSDLRESGNIEQDADVVLLLYRGDYYEQDQTKHTNIAELIVGKQRNGPTGKIDLVWNKLAMRFNTKAKVF